MTDADQRGAIRFAEKVLELLDEGRYTATDKYALLLAPMDICLEHTQNSGAAPAMVTTRQLADKIVELYWPHTIPFAGMAPATVLQQNTAGQAEIVSTITQSRARYATDPSVPRWESRMMAPEAYEGLVRRVEWKLIEMPLPRLQIMGQAHRPFIYDIYWDDALKSPTSRPDASTAITVEHHQLGAGPERPAGVPAPLRRQRWRRQGRWRRVYPW